MPVTLNLTDLMDYTEWERQKWHSWFKQQGDQALATTTGPHSGDRFKTVGDIIKHIFSAEMRYIDRLSNRPLSDPASVPSDNSEALFEFGAQSRSALRKFIETLPPTEWDAIREFDFFGGLLRVTPKKIVTHVLLHETRHWAQIATILRMNGLKDDMHDFIFTPVLGGELIRNKAKS
ncbi:MAG TPA: DinB family protein [Candidatus Acidoferrales bacterium]|nr:DinB family protein [Candidatus Acidoferrales bacterium]